MPREEKPAGLKNKRKQAAVAVVVEETNPGTVSSTTQNLQGGAVTPDTRAAVAAAKGKVPKAEDATQGVKTVEAVVLTREMQTMANCPKVTVFGGGKVVTVRLSVVSI